MGIRFGLFADLHSSLPGQPERGSSLRTAEDLKKALERFRAAGCSFAVSLGDNTQPSSTAAEQFEQMKSLAESWNGYGFPVHLVPGNHEFQQLTPDEIRAAVMEHAYDKETQTLTLQVVDPQAGTVPLSGHSVCRYAVLTYPSVPSSRRTRAHPSVTFSTVTIVPLASFSISFAPVSAVSRSASVLPASESATLPTL